MRTDWQLKKQQQQAKAESKKVRLSPRTDSGALQTKAVQVAKMLAKGQRVQIFIFVKTREDRLQQHEVGVPLLTQLHDSVLQIAGTEHCWYLGVFSFGLPRLAAHGLLPLLVTRCYCCFLL